MRFMTLPILIPLISTLSAFACTQPKSSTPASNSHAVEESVDPQSQTLPEPKPDPSAISSDSDEDVSDTTEIPTSKPPLPGITRPAALDPMWNIPEIVWPDSRTSTLRDLALITKNRSRTAAQQALEVFTAEENYAKLNALAHQSLSSSGTNVNTAERIELDALIDTTNAELKRYGHLVAGDISKVQSGAFEIEEKRKLIAIGTAKVAYLSVVQAQILDLIAQGEAPASWADRIASRISATLVSIEDYKLAVKTIAADLLPILGGENIENLGVGRGDSSLELDNSPISPGELLIALDLSLAIQEIQLRIEATDHRIALLDWNFSQLTSPTPQQRIEWIAAKNLELLNLRFLQEAVATQESNIHTSIALAVGSLEAARNKLTFAQNALTTSSGSYGQSLTQFGSGEISTFDLLDRAEDVFDAQIAIVSSHKSVAKALAAIDHLLYINEFAIALDPPETP